MGKAAAVALSQSYEVTAFRELITELRERNGAAEQNGKKKQNKQESEPPFLSLSAVGASC